MPFTITGKEIVRISQTFYKKRTVPTRKRLLGTLVIGSIGGRPQSAGGAVWPWAILVDDSVRNSYNSWLHLQVARARDLVQLKLTAATRPAASETGLKSINWRKRNMKEMLVQTLTSTKCRRLWFRRGLIKQNNVFSLFLNTKFNFFLYRKEMSAGRIND